MKPSAGRGGDRPPRASAPPSSGCTRATFSRAMSRTSQLRRPCCTWCAKMRRASPAERPSGARELGQLRRRHVMQDAFHRTFEVAQQSFRRAASSGAARRSRASTGAGDARQIAHIAHPARQRHEAVEVGAERDRVFAGDLDDVLDVIADGLDGGAEQAAQEVGGEDDADDAALLADGAQLLVVEVARMRLERLAARVRREDRRLRRVDEIPEGALRRRG